MCYAFAAKSLPTVIALAMSLLQGAEPVDDTVYDIVCMHVPGRRSPPAHPAVHILANVQRAVTRVEFHPEDDSPWRGRVCKRAISDRGPLLYCPGCSSRNRRRANAGPRMRRGTHVLRGRGGAGVKRTNANDCSSTTATRGGRTGAANPTGAHPRGELQAVPKVPVDGFGGGVVEMTLTRQDDASEF
ncbi:hypothetical protein B0H11DRAFT_1913020 [Mycena galericulata]|nr:hypothetical protein B0H11DRAFT_1913020 [Mycena galericulata]